MNEAASDLHAMLASLGHASRFRIALSLIQGERCVGDLALAIGLSQSCTTRHIQALERAGLVRSRRDGKRVLVGLDRERRGVAPLIGWLLSGSGTAPRDGGIGKGPRPSPSRATRSIRATKAVDEQPRGAPLGASRTPEPEAEASAPETSVGGDAETPHDSGRASGTSADSKQDSRPGFRRPRESLEDFLL